MSRPTRSRAAVPERTRGSRQLGRPRKKASALGIKQRTGAIDAQQPQGVWARFERMVAADLSLLPIEPAHFHRAAELVLEPASALRAGEALHLVCAEPAGSKQMANLMTSWDGNAQRLKIKPVVLREAR